MNQVAITKYQISVGNGTHKSVRITTRIVNYFDIGEENLKDLLTGVLGSVILAIGLGVIFNLVGLI